MGGAPSITSLFVQRVVIGVGDMAVSNNSQSILTTYALGSCVGVLAYDPAVKAAGILHLMLPDSAISPEKAMNQPAMFADTGLPLLFKALAGLHADPRRLQVMVTGGASVLNGQDPFKIGDRNAKTTMDWLRSRGLPIRHCHTGGTENRTVHLEVDTGRVSLKMPTGTDGFSLAA
ncbi:MAG TPA: chemotaxis protein CheD [Opitutus sp.]|nr:chemotaxis protein CheD [Opitutus sp.]